MMTSTVSLGALEGDTIRPMFRGTADGRDLIVELDTSALIKLVDGRVGENRLASLEAQRGRVRAAAQALYEGGYLNAGDILPRIVVSAIDLD